MKLDRRNQIIDMITQNRTVKNSELMEKFDISIEKQKIVVNDPIKAFGTYEVKCRMGYEITGTIHLVVTEAK